MSGRIGEQDRTRFLALVDVMLPGDGRAPSGNAVGVAETGLDRVLDLRPDLLPDLLAALRYERDSDPAEAVRQLAQGDGDEWLALRVVAFGAYYNSPQLQELLGYAGQPSNPVELADVPDCIGSGLLAPVLARSPMWRPA